MRPILSLVLAVLSLSVLAQETPSRGLPADSALIAPKHRPTAIDYANIRTAYPAPRRDRWVVGVDVGTPMILGDIPACLNAVAAGIHVRKSLTPFLSLRFQSIFMQSTGFDGSPRRVGAEPTDLDHLNYRARMTDHTVQVVFNINNLLYDQRDPRVSLNLFGGVGVLTSFTQRNALDADGQPYDHSSIWTVDGGLSEELRARRQHVDLLDDGWETTVAPPAPGEPRIGDTRIHPSFVLGAGLDIRLSDRLDLNLSSRVSRHLTDKLDGWVSEREDWLLVMSAGLSIKLGKGTQPAWMTNPTAHLHDEVMALRTATDSDEILSDLDQDGVVDALDLDPNTPAGVDVDARGRALDSDGDGVIDARDQEVFSPTGARVNGQGQALDGDGDGVPDVHDQEPDSAPGASVDVRGRTIQAGGDVVNNVLTMRGVDVWTVFFPTDGSTVEEDYMPIILNLASYMIADPSAELIVTGHADGRADDDYNQQLALERAENVVATFVNIGIDGRRFEVRSKGENDHLVQAAADDDLLNRLNRRVTLRVK